ncbi:RusA-like resolvase [Mycobacterium phage Nazo]|uniref:RusA-like resolvase n=1 Tax=Mycobacterium phage Nazo TaxID=1897547 RepID=A0A1D8EV23_9CAUD|nr:RusA-like resolvase [Mycobacterium phage Nazo]
MTRIGQVPETTDVDAERVIELLRALRIDDDAVRVLTIPGNPYSKSRPRFNRKGGAYHKDEDKNAEQRTAVYLRATVRRRFTGNVALAAVFYRSSAQRVDADNLLKHVCDAGNGVLWVDDCQATATTGVIELDRKNPRTVIAVAPHTSSMVRDLSTPKPLTGGLFSC